MHFLYHTIGVTIMQPIALFAYTNIHINLDSRCIRNGFIFLLSSCVYIIVSLGSNGNPVKRDKWNSQEASQGPNR